MAGFWQSILSGVIGQRIFAPRIFNIGGGGEAIHEYWADMSACKLWRSQPHLRTVVSFRARNTAQLGLHVYKRTPDGGRERDRESVLAKTLEWVNDDMTTYDLIFALVGDYDLHDRAYWLVAESAESPSGWTIHRVPPTWVEVVKDNPFRIKGYRVTIGQKTMDVPPENMVRFPGFHPDSPTGASSTVEALKETLKEQLEAATFRKQLWQRGGKVSSILQRPLDAPEWSADAREAFREDWYAKYTGNGSLAGGTPILEDGMTLNRIDFSAQDQQWVEAARLSLETVAAAFHVPAAMVGMGSEATFSNMRAFRKMLYTETLGPLLAYIEARINKSLVAVMGLDPAVYYVEFNIMEKLQGDFEEQAAVLSSAIGRPWMTADEGRSRMNMPKLGGSADELVVPLNVLLGGQSSPRDSGSQNEVADPEQDQTPKSLGVATKSKPTQTEVDKHAEVLAEFFRRQGKSVASRVGAGDSWWDKDRWDRELSEDLLKLAAMTSTEAAVRALMAAGLNPDDYDVDRTLAFLREASFRNAERINEATERQVREALDDPDSDGDAVDRAGHVFEVAESSRAVQAAVTLAGFAAGFGTLESGRQSGGATKTWVVTSSNPRPSHRRLNGMTIPLDEDFPNGLAWPGAAGGDVDEVAGCSCSLRINY